MKRASLLTASLKQQYVWLQWVDIAEPFDFSWKNIIWGGISAEIFKFVLTASVNWVRTPDLLSLWQYKKLATAVYVEQKNVIYITSSLNVTFSARQKIYLETLVLSLISKAFQTQLEFINSTQNFCSKPAFINFVKAGSEINQKHNPIKQIRSHLLSNANDWKFLTDLPGTNYVFPPEVYSTPERPDILIWSPKLRTILMLELTCPAEEGIQAAKLRKQSKYMPLLNNISNGTAWKPILLTLEVGA